MSYPNQPFYILLPLDDEYEGVTNAVNDAMEYDNVFTIKDFADFIEDIVSTLLPCNLVNGFNSAIEKAFIFLGPNYAYDTVLRIQQDLAVQIRHLQLPVYPVGGFRYRFYITGDLNLHIHYEPESLQAHIKQLYTRDDILECIENGDYISDKLKRQYGI